MRRSTSSDRTVSYAAVGSTVSPHFILFPPSGFRAVEYRARLGSGDERFAVASASLMTWGVQRGSGVRVAQARAMEGEQYHGVLFDRRGRPLPDQPRLSGETRFATDGTPYITPGMTAVLKYGNGIGTVNAHIRVLLVIDEPDRAGFAYGTLKQHPECGEEFFVVEHRADDTVWLVYRRFSRPNGVWRTLTAPRSRARHKRYTKRYLRVLHPVAGA